MINTNQDFSDYRDRLEALDTWRENRDREGTGPRVIANTIQDRIVVLLNEAFQAGAAFERARTAPLRSDLALANRALDLAVETRKLKDREIQQLNDTIQRLLVLLDEAQSQVQALNDAAPDDAPPESE